ncbi:MAG TPA: acetylornithine deacetylase/succinyl-diaminopimelate desuccinylase family protein [Geminicoccaceae bacterium]|nr:acetylornithine deacetylase/succinyl-diaminopimelate desuccinylase family protein [Geminicoccus sp.]HMU49268.1 acetylornithine deacetylase/succinyl-diaminopimelate desuccinylase family protein [Geminicoccaceae bacterium]
MAQSPAVDQLLARIDDRQGELVGLTRDLVRIPTVNPPGDAYRPCAELLGERLRARGFEVAYLRAEGTPGDQDRYPRLNVVARRESGRPGPCVHFNGHIDVVEAGHGWTVDPFAAVVRDGRIYGRGTCDMKGGIAASVIAVEALLESEIPLAGALEVSGTVDEESGGYGGVAWLAERGFFSKPRVDHVVIPEPLNVDRVCVGHRGVWWAEIETLGRIAHGSMPFLGDCAVRHMAAFLHRVETELLPSLATRTTAMPVVPAGARSSTLNINAVHGGQAEGFTGLPSPCVPDSCRAVIDRRYLIEEDPAAVKAEIRRLLESLERDRPGFRWKLRELMEVRPVMTDATAPVPRAVSASIRQILGRDAEIVASPGTYDQKHIVRIGKLEDCVAYGPGILDLAHQPDEYVEIDALVASAKVMALSVLRLQGALA